MSDLVSVLVLNWNGEKYLRNCLDSIRLQDYGNIEIIVVDNGSTDRSIEIMEKDYPEVRLFQTGRNLGFAAGNNVGIRKASGDYIVVLNNDAEMDKCCVSVMKKAIDTDPGYGACASRIYLKFETDVLDAAGIVICPDGLSIGRGRLEPADRYNRQEEVFFASGCCMMCRKEMLEDVKIGESYFDEDFFMYADDTDLGWRARLRGWKTIYAPEAKAYHLHSASSETYSSLKAFLVERNRLWVQIKYFPITTILWGQLFTAVRYLFQVYGAFAGKGASGGFTKDYSKTTLAKVLIQAWCSALKGLPPSLVKRKIVQRRRTIRKEELQILFRAYGIGASRIALKG